jgi:hypothetical protein
MNHSQYRIASKLVEMIHEDFRDFIWISRRAPRVAITQVRSKLHPRPGN